MFAGCYLYNQRLCMATIGFLTLYINSAIDCAGAQMAQQGKEMAAEKAEVYVYKMRRQGRFYP
jgi:hypothetical protein